jgi:hypothetical protein
MINPFWPNHWFQPTANNYGLEGFPAFNECPHASH